MRRMRAAAAGIAVAAVVTGQSAASAAPVVHVGPEGPFTLRVGAGTVIDVELPRQGALTYRPDGSPVDPYTAPCTKAAGHCAASAVLATLSSSSTPAGAAAQFRADMPGTAAVTWSGPSGIICTSPPQSGTGGGCIGVTAASPTVVDVTVTQTVSVPGAGAAPHRPSGAAVGGVAAATALVALGGGVVFRRRRSIRG